MEGYMRNGVISLLSVLLRVRPLGTGKLGAWMWHWSPPIPPSQSSQAEDRGRETIWEATALDPCAHMAGSTKEETSSSPGAVRVLELSSCSLLSYITRRMRRGWREWESRANEGKIRNVVEDVLLLYRLAGYRNTKMWTRGKAAYVEAGEVRWNEPAVYDAAGETEKCVMKEGTLTGFFSVWGQNTTKWLILGCGVLRKNLGMEE